MRKLLESTLVDFMLDLPKNILQCTTGQAHK